MPDAATCMHRVRHDWSDLAASRDDHTRWSPRKTVSPDITYMCNLKYDTNEFIYETDSQI